MAACDFNNTGPEEADEDTDIDDDDALIDIDYGHDDIEDIDLIMIVDRDDEQ
jgi:hypothetical protein